MEITEKPWGFERLWAHTEDYVGKTLFIKAGRSSADIHVEPGQIHRFGATHSSVELVEVSTNYLDDVVRLEDDYRRE